MIFNCLLTEKMTNKKVFFDVNIDIDIAISTLIILIIISNLKTMSSAITKMQKQCLSPCNVVGLRSSFSPSRKPVAKNAAFDRARRRFPGSGQQLGVSAGVEERRDGVLQHGVHLHVRQQGTWKPAHGDAHDPAAAHQAPCW